MDRTTGIAYVSQEAHMQYITEVALNSFFQTA